MRNVGPYAEGLEHPGMQEDLGYTSWLEDGYETLLEQAQMQAEWFTGLAKYLLEREGWDAFIMHYHLPDALNHWLIGYLHERHPEYGEERAREVLEVYERGYRIMGSMIGELASLVGEDSTIVVASDHGSLPHWKFVNPIPKLVERGLIAYKWNPEERVFEVDWEKTKVFPCLIALALRKEDAMLLGQWGDRVGDVVYFLKPSYSCWNTPGFDKVGPKVFALGDVAPVERRPTNVTGYHSTYPPTARIGRFEIAAPLIIAGEGVERGCRGDRPVHMVDVAPTILHLLGLEVPSYMGGRILREILA